MPNILELYKKLHLNFLIEEEKSLFLIYFLTIIVFFGNKNCITFFKKQTLKI